MPRYWRTNQWDQEIFCIEEDNGDRRVVGSDGHAFQQQEAELRAVQFPQNRAAPATDAFSAVLQGAVLSECQLAPGEYFARIWRGEDSPMPHEIYPTEWPSSVSAASVLFRDMREVFRFVQPAGVGLRAFGHEIRNLLVLACMEVESACKAILRANSYVFSGNPTMHDYVKLSGPLRLPEWELSLPGQPDVPSFRPFAGWDGWPPTTPPGVKPAPTAALDWYAAHHQVKHDRESNFPEATVERMIHAMGAVFVMVTAQFAGWRLPRAAAMSPMLMQSVHAPFDFTILREPQWSRHELGVPHAVASPPASGWTRKTSDSELLRLSKCPGQRSEGVHFDREERWTSAAERARFELKLVRDTVKQSLRGLSDLGIVDLPCL